MLISIKQKSRARKPGLVKGKVLGEHHLQQAAFGRKHVAEQPVLGALHPLVRHRADIHLVGHQIQVRRPAASFLISKVATRIRDCIA